MSSPEFNVGDGMRSPVMDEDDVVVAVDRDVESTECTLDFSILKSFPHDSGSTSTLYFPSQERIVSSHQDRSIRIWNTRNQVCEKIIRDNRSTILHLIKFREDVFICCDKSGDISSYRFTKFRMAVEKRFSVSQYSAKKFYPIRMLKLSDDHFLVAYSSGKLIVISYSESLKNDPKAITELSDVDINLFSRMVKSKLYKNGFYINTIPNTKNRRKYNILLIDFKKNRVLRHVTKDYISDEECSGAALRSQFSIHSMETILNCEKEEILIFAGSEGVIYFYKVDSDEIIDHVGVENPILSSTVTRNYLIFGDSRGYVSVLSMSMEGTSGEEIMCTRSKIHSKDVTDLNVIEDVNSSYRKNYINLVSSSNDNSLKTIKVMIKNNKFFGLPSRNPTSPSLKDPRFGPSQAFQRDRKCASLNDAMSKPRRGSRSRRSSYSLAIPNYPSTSTSQEQHSSTRRNERTRRRRRKSEAPQQDSPSSLPMNMRRLALSSSKRNRKKKQNVGKSGQEITIELDDVLRGEGSSGQIFYSIIYFSSHRKLVSCSFDESLRVWDLTSKIRSDNESNKQRITSKIILSQSVSSISNKSISPKKKAIKKKKGIMQILRWNSDCLLVGWGPELYSVNVKTEKISIHEDCKQLFEDGKIKSLLKTPNSDNFLCVIEYSKKDSFTGLNYIFHKMFVMSFCLDQQHQQLHQQFRLRMVKEVLLNQGLDPLESKLGIGYHTRFMNSKKSLDCVFMNECVNDAYIGCAKKIKMINLTKNEIEKEFNSHKKIIYCIDTFLIPKNVESYQNEENDDDNETTNHGYDEILVCGGVEKILYFYDVSSSSCLRRIAMKNEIWSSKIIFENKYCFVGDDLGFIHCFIHQPQSKNKKKSRVNDQRKKNDEQNNEKCDECNYVRYEKFREEKFHNGIVRDFESFTTTSGTDDQFEILLNLITCSSDKTIKIHQVRNLYNVLNDQNLDELENDEEEELYENEKFSLNKKKKKKEESEKKSFTPTTSIHEENDEDDDPEDAVMFGGMELTPLDDDSDDNPFLENQTREEEDDDVKQETEKSDGGSSEEYGFCDAVTSLTPISPPISPTELMDEMSRNTGSSVDQELMNMKPQKYHRDKRRKKQKHHRSKEKRNRKRSVSSSSSSKQRHHHLAGLGQRRNSRHHHSERRSEQTPLTPSKIKTTSFLFQNNNTNENGENVPSERVIKSSPAGIFEKSGKDSPKNKFSPFASSSNSSSLTDKRKTAEMEYNWFVKFENLNKTYRNECSRFESERRSMLRKLRKSSDRSRKYEMIIIENEKVFTKRNNIVKKLKNDNSTLKESLRISSTLLRQKKTNEMISRKTRIEKYLKELEDEESLELDPSLHFRYRMFVGVGQKIHNIIFHDTGREKAFKDLSLRKSEARIDHFFETIVSDPKNDLILKPFLEHIKKKYHDEWINGCQMNLKKNSHELSEKEIGFFKRLITEVSDFYGGLICRPDDDDDDDVNKKGKCDEKNEKEESGDHENAKKSTKFLNDIEKMCELRINEIKQKKKSNLILLGDLKGCGVCRHRSILFKLICDMLGIRCRLLRGWIQQRETMQHPGQQQHDHHQQDVNDEKQKYQSFDDFYKNSHREAKSIRSVKRPKNKNYHSHCWNMVQIGGKFYVADLMRRLSIIGRDVGREYVNLGGPENEVEKELKIIELIEHEYLSRRKFIKAGSFGAVYEVNTETVDEFIDSSNYTVKQTTVAVKELNITDLISTTGNDYRKYCEREMMFLKFLNHPNIVRYFGSFTRYQVNPRTKKQEEFLCLIMEYFDRTGYTFKDELLTLDLSNINKTELFFLNNNNIMNQQNDENNNNNNNNDLENPENYVEDVEKMTYYHKLQELFIFLIGVCKGLRYMHSVGVIHFDLHPKNILVKWNDESNTIMKVVITDFGGSKEMESYFRTSLPAGAPAFTAPEIRKFKLKLASEFANSMSKQGSGSNLSDGFKGKLKGSDNLKFTGKSDIFSFGKLMEILMPLVEEFPEVLKIQQQCLEDSPDRRPSLNELIYIFKNRLRYVDNQMKKIRYEVMQRRLTISGGFDFFKSLKKKKKGDDDEK